MARRALKSLESVPSSQWLHQHHTEYLSHEWNDDGSFAEEDYHLLMSLQGGVLDLGKAGGLPEGPTHQHDRG